LASGVLPDVFRCGLIRTPSPRQRQASGIIKKTDICRRVGSFNALLNDLKATAHFSRAFGPLRSFPQKAAAGIVSPVHCTARPHWDLVALACRRRCSEFCLG